MSTERQSGMTLIELVIAIVIIGIGLAGVLTVFNSIVRNSADPTIRKQMLSIAEGMMEEATLRPFAVQGTAPVNVVRDCRSGAAGVAPRAEFDDVSDYAGYRTRGICNVAGEPVVALADYSVSVTVIAASSIDGVAVGAGEVKKVSVVVSHGAETLQLNGWRINYAKP